jgi:hypothetical protein
MITAAMDAAAGEGARICWQRNCPHGWSGDPPSVGRARTSCRSGVRDKPGEAAHIATYRWAAGEERRQQAPEGRRCAQGDCAARRRHHRAGRGHAAGASRAPSASAVVGAGRPRHHDCPRCRPGRGNHGGSGVRTRSSRDAAFRRHGPQDAGARSLLGCAGTNAEDAASRASGKPRQGWTAGRPTEARCRHGGRGGRGGPLTRRDRGCPLASPPMLGTLAGRARERR